jgi:hypothetical protein
MTDKTLLDALKDLEHWSFIISGDIPAGNWRNWGNFRFSIDRAESALREAEAGDASEEGCTTGCLINTQVGSDHRYCTCHCHDDPASQPKETGEELPDIIDGSIMDEVRKDIKNLILEEYAVKCETSADGCTWCEYYPCDKDDPRRADYCPIWWTKNEPMDPYSSAFPPKEKRRELGEDEIMQSGDYIIWPDHQCEPIGYRRGMMVKEITGLGSGKVYRPAQPKEERCMCGHDKCVHRQVNGDNTGACRISICGCNFYRPAPAQGEKHPAMLALEHLTPGGSEFYEDIPRCVEWIKDRINHNWEMAKKGRMKANRFEDALRKARPFVYRYQLKMDARDIADHGKEVDAALAAIEKILGDEK